MLNLRLIQETALPFPALQLTTMASKVKRMFHRRKDDPNSPSHDRVPNTARSEPALRTSLYETAVSGGLPQTGEYPMKGNDSSVVLQQQGRKSSMRSQRSLGSRHNRSPTPEQHSSQANRAMAASPPSDIVNPDLQASRQHRRSISGSEQNGQISRSRGHLSNNFSAMNLNNTGLS